MKKRNVIFLFLAVLNFKGFSQALVIDMQAIAAAIQNGLTMGQQLETSINQLKSTYEMINNQVINMNPMDMSYLSQSSLNELFDVSQKYSMLTDNLEEKYKSKTMRVGNIEFSVEDLCSTNVYQAIKEDFGELSQNVSDAVKNAFYRKYGVEYDTFLRLYTLGEQVSGKAKEIKSNKDDIKKVVSSLADISGSIAQNISSETGEAAILQKSALLASENLLALSQTLETVSNIGELISSQYAQEMDLLSQQTTSEMAGYGAMDNTSFYISNSVGDDSAYRGMGRH